ncbi:Conserved_hypothetical protein [Hexamita inflata]|uniref:Uncharacterized protein n=1 Tax=Hexamita inflata TaxID=28002 RepID=A0AA86P6B4_9EUKA|nr:Conserved hypothetical protein [Hexamita inflata]
MSNINTTQYDRQTVIKLLANGQKLYVNNIYELQHILSMNIQPCFWKNAFKQNQIDLKTAITHTTKIELNENNRIESNIIFSFVNVSQLAIVENKLCKLTNISHLKNLVTLNLACNQITDIQEIDKLKNLTHLDLYGNFIQVYSLNLPKLAYLDLNKNQLHDVQGVKFSPSLLTLHLSAVQNIMPVQYLCNITELILENTQIVDISPLQFLVNMKTLIMVKNEYLQNITPLKHCTKLEALNVKSAAIESIWALHLLKSLVFLQLSNCKIVDIHPLKYCTNLKFLDLQWNLIMDPDPIQNLSMFITLYINGNLIQDVYNFAYLSSYQRLCQQNTPSMKQIQFNKIISDIHNSENLIQQINNNQLKLKSFLEEKRSKINYFLNQQIQILNKQTELLIVLIQTQEFIN